MSLLYECISGLISGGLLSPIRHSPDSDELALVCVTKLRGFLTDDGDSNLKYVGLLAMTKLVATHPHLVAQHQDVILNCIDDADITIRYRALELVVGMVDETTLPSVVGRLMRQLKPRSGEDREMVELEAAEVAEDDDDMQEEVMRGGAQTKGQVVALELPDDYRRCVIEKVVQMCARDMYANIADFEWYLDVLIQLVRYAPPVQNVDNSNQDEEGGEYKGAKDVGEDIGRELRNVAVRVKSVRPEAVRCAEVLLSRRDGVFPSAGGGGLLALGPAAWIAGEYSRSAPLPFPLLPQLTPFLAYSQPPTLPSTPSSPPPPFPSRPKYSPFTSNQSLKFSPPISQHPLLLGHLTANHPFTSSPPG